MLRPPGARHAYQNHGWGISHLAMKGTQQCVTFIHAVAFHNLIDIYRNCE